MKIRSVLAILLVSAVLVPVSVAAKDKKKKEETAPAFKLENRMDSVSYSLGVLFGGNLAQSGLNDIKTKVMSTAIDSVLVGKKTLFTPEEANAILGQFFQEKQKAKSDKNLKDGQAFLEKNKQESGVVVLPSGLQYKVIKAGDGPKPGPTDKVTVHYHGTLIDGKVFDSSVERGQPIQLSVDGVIKGWTEALQLMPVGSKWKLFIPADLGYGDSQMQGSPIEPNSTLIFDVELISIDKEQPAAEEPVIPQVDNKPEVKPADKKK
jgi:FKBP-type peptidyl-prolyl cis-trans isomerase FklB